MLQILTCWTIRQYNLDEMMQAFFKCLLNLINDVTEFNRLTQNKH